MTRTRLLLGGLALALSIVLAIEFVEWDRRTPLIESLSGSWAGQVLRQRELEAARVEVEARRDHVLEVLSLGGLAQPWADTYAWGNGYESRTLELYPSGFVFEYGTCTGTIELVYGDVLAVEGALVRLKAHTWWTRDGQRASRSTERPFSSTRRRSDFRFEEELFLVPWGDLEFLVPAHQMPEFCELSTAGRWDSMTYADYPKRVRPGAGRNREPWTSAGQPVVPEEFRHLLPGH